MAQTMTTADQARTDRARILHEPMWDWRGVTPNQWDTASIAAIAQRPRLPLGQYNTAAYCPHGYELCVELPDGAIAHDLAALPYLAPDPCAGSGHDWFSGVASTWCLRPGCGAVAPSARHMAATAPIEAGLSVTARGAETNPDQARQDRARFIAQGGATWLHGYLRSTGRKVYGIPSQSDPSVRYWTNLSFCTCPDFQRRGVECKHVYAVRSYVARVRAARQERAAA